MGIRLSSLVFSISAPETSYTSPRHQNILKYDTQFVRRFGSENHRVVSRADGAWISIGLPLVAVQSSVAAGDGGAEGQCENRMTATQK